MSRDKQIEEMAEAIFMNCHCGLFEDEAKMIAKFCYQEIDRKASEVAREIFEEIEDLLHEHYVEWDFCYFDDYLGEDFDELKKKYTEEGK